MLKESPLTYCNYGGYYKQKTNAKNLETFEALTNKPSTQVHHIDPHILSWNFLKLPKAPSKFRAIDQQTLKAIRT